MRAMLVKIHGNLAAAVAEPDHENTLTAKWFAGAVFAAVEDAAAEALLARPRGHVRDGVVARRHDHLVGAIDTVFRGRNPSLGTSRHAVHFLTKLRSETKVVRVPLEVGNRLVARRVTRRLCGKIEVRQGRVILDGVQMQAVVVVTPARADLGGPLHDNERCAAFPQAGCDGEAGGPGAYDQGFRL